MYTLKNYHVDFMCLNTDPIFQCCDKIPFVGLVYVGNVFVWEKFNLFIPYDIFIFQISLYFQLNQNKTIWKSFFAIISLSMWPELYSILKHITVHYLTIMKYNMYINGIVQYPKSMYVKTIFALENYSCNKP